MSRVWLGAAWRQGSEHGLEAEFEIADGHGAVDGPLPELAELTHDLGVELIRFATRAQQLFDQAQTDNVALDRRRMGRFWITLEAEQAGPCIALRHRCAQ
jgi:hypothetical protein